MAPGCCPPLPPTAPSAAATHECGAFCNVVHEFGNLYRCMTSGMMHVCDMNCNQRMWFDRHSTICRVSRRFFPPFQDGPSGMQIDVARKRSSDDALPLHPAQAGARKRPSITGTAA